MSDPRDTASNDPARHQPWDIEIEQSVLGACLRDNKFIDAAAADLDGSKFYDPLHGRIFDLMVYLQTEGAVTPLLVHSIMKTDPGIIETGGMNYLMAMYQAAPSMPRMREFVAVLLEHSMRRELLSMSHPPAN